MIKFFIVLLIFNNLNINGIVNDIMKVYNYGYNYYQNIINIQDDNEKIEIKNL